MATTFSKSHRSQDVGCLWVVQTKFQPNYFNSLCSILATDLENIFSRNMKLGSHELTFNLQYQDRRVLFPDRELCKKIDFLKTGRLC